MKQFDQSLHAAANIDIPDGLADRILLKHGFEQQRQQKSMRLKLYAMAASLFLVVGISMNMSSFTNMLDDSLSLGDIAINHVTDELDHLSENKNIQLANLNTLLKPFNIKFKQAIGKVNYAGSCAIRNSRGAHIVVQDNNTTATLLVMPGEYIKNRQTHNKGDYTTTLIPTQNGSIAIVTEKGTQPDVIKKLESNLNKTLQYI